MPAPVGAMYGGQGQGPSCFDRMKMGAMLGFAVGMASGAIFGGVTALRWELFLTENMKRSYWTTIHSNLKSKLLFCLTGMALGEESLSTVPGKQCYRLEAPLVHLWLLELALDVRPCYLFYKIKTNCFRVNQLFTCLNSCHSSDLLYVFLVTYRLVLLHRCHQ